MILPGLPASAQPGCANCPFAKEGKPPHQPVLGTCIKGPRGVLVGESPGGEEVDQGEVFVGRTGQWLNDRMAENGLERDDLALINAIACQPGKGMKTDSNMEQAAHACFPLFNHQFQPYHASKTPTLAMGKWAAWATNGGHGVSVETGRGFIREREGQKWTLTWHPTYAAFYNPWKAGEFVIDLERFRRLIDGKLEPAPKTLIRPTVADIARLVKASRGVLACDIETRAPHGKPPYWGKDPTRADLKTIALGTADCGVAYWWGSRSDVQSAIVRVLHDPKIVKVFHNGYMFDGRVLARFGIKPTPIMDTRDMRRAVSATSRLSLRFLASVYSDFAPWKEDEK